MQVSVFNNVIQTLTQGQLQALIKVANPILREAGHIDGVQRLTNHLDAGEHWAASAYLQSPDAQPLRQTILASSEVIAEHPTFRGSWELWTKRTTPPKAKEKIRLDSPIDEGFRLRSYQQRLLESLERDVARVASPFLGIASPMQTGKSALIPFIIQMVQRYFGEAIRVFVVTSSHITTNQISGDLTRMLGEDAVGRLDGPVKELKRVTVSSIFTLRPYLSLFPTDQPTVLIFDEAVWSQTPSGRKVIEYFGLGEQKKMGRRTRVFPKKGNGLIIGLSGTGWGLECYRVSDQLDILTAIDNGWVRHLIGKREFPEASAKEVQGTREPRMIWWLPTEENARVLADIYDERIHGQYEKNQIFVPTIRHGKLLADELRRRHGNEAFEFVHCDMKEDFPEVMARWHERRNDLIAIRRTSFGMRGTGTGAIWHTYQTTSPEFFAQRSGRGWGIDPSLELQPLMIFECVWDRSSKFWNLARLLGLSEYPYDRIDTQEGVKKIEERIKRDKDPEKILREILSRGKIGRLFNRYPRVEKWRLRFHRLVKERGGVAALARSVRFRQDIVAAYALGVLPVRSRWIIDDGTEDGKQEMLKLWVESWDEVVDDVLIARRQLVSHLERRLIEWQRIGGPLEHRVEKLDAILWHSYKNPYGPYEFVDRARLWDYYQQALPYLKQEIEESKRGIIQAADVDLWWIIRAIYAKDQEIPIEDVPGPSIIARWLLYDGSMWTHVNMDILQRLPDVGFRSQDLEQEQPKIVASFREALDEMRDKIALGRTPGQKPVKIKDVVAQAYERYQEKNPLRKESGKIVFDKSRFRGYVAGDNASPELIRMFLKAGLFRPVGPPPTVGQRTQKEAKEIKPDLNIDLLRKYFQEAIPIVKAAIEKDVLVRGPLINLNENIWYVISRLYGKDQGLPIDQWPDAEEIARVLLFDGSDGERVITDILETLLKLGLCKREYTFGNLHSSIVATFRGAISDMRDELERDKVIERAYDKYRKIWAPEAWQKERITKDTFQAIATHRHPWPEIIKLFVDQGLAQPV